MFYMQKFDLMFKIEISKSLITLRVPTINVKTLGINVKMS